MNEGIITRSLCADNYAANTVIANFTPPNWWENDVCMVTKSGYWIEYEVKLTVADFRVDSQKQKEVLPRAWGEPVKFENKHDLLANTERGPCRFFYVVPEGLLANEQLPVWAGLIEVVGTAQSRVYFREKVAAPRRHKRKDESLVSRIHESCYWRFHRLPVLP